MEAFDALTEFGSRPGGGDADGIGGPVDESRDFCGFEGVLISEVKKSLHGGGQFFETCGQPICPDFGGGGLFRGSEQFEGGGFESWLVGFSQAGEGLEPGDGAGPCHEVGAELEVSGFAGDF